MVAASGNLGKEDQDDFMDFIHDLQAKAQGGERKLYRPKSRAELEALLNPAGGLPGGPRTEVVEE